MGVVVIIRVTKVLSAKYDSILLQPEDIILQRFQSVAHEHMTSLFCLPQASNRMFAPCLSPNSIMSMGVVLSARRPRRGVVMGFIDG